LEKVAATDAHAIISKFLRLQSGLPLKKRRQLRVLLVEDSATQAHVRRAQLLHYGFEVEVLTRLADVLKRLAQPGIDVILLDLTLPDSAGLDTFFAVHTLAEDAPIVILSADDDEEIALQAMKGGAQDYLIKGRASPDSIGRCLTYAVERNQIEAELRHSEKLTRLILENSYDAFWAIDSAGELIGWNKQAENTFGYSREEVLGKRLEDAIVLPRFLESHLKIMDEMLKTGHSRILNRRIEVLLRRKDDTDVPVELVVFPVQVGELTTYCTFAHDITERRQIEERTRRLNEELEQRVQERTSALQVSNAQLQQFAKIASHDLQEPLRSVEGYANLLEKRYRGKLDSDGDEFIDFIQEGIKRMLELIQSVLRHSSIESSDVKQMSVVDMRKVLKEVLENLRVAIEETQSTVLVGDLPNVQANRTEMVQLFQNLIGNAIKYHGKEAPIIKVSCEENVHELVFSVEDNGIGIESKYADKIFDMFARLHGKTQFKGTGIGLAICKKIVETHCGRIWIQSEPGKGSIFIFTLPKVAVE
jgi:PAS domain S-box-containing protein